MTQHTYTKALGSTLVPENNNAELKAGSSIIVSGLSGAETAALKIKAGSSYINAIDSAGDAITFSATDTAVTIGGAGIYATDIGTTDAAVTVVFNFN